MPVDDEGRTSVQLTIDSVEPLEYVLRVVGSLYGTELAIAAPTSSSKASAAKTKPARRRKKTGTTGATGRRARGGGPATADVRAWAQEQGHQVAARGQLPGSIVRAYTDAHR